MAVKITEVRSGAFVVLAGIVLAVLVFSVGRFRTRLQETTHYHAYLADAKFLKVHDPVAYAGIRVGEVRSVEVSADRFGLIKVTLEVAKGTPVREDSLLILKQDGMLGPKYIEISPGSEGARAAAEGDELKGLVPPALTDLTGAIEGPLRKLDRILDHLDRIFGSPENQKNLADILGDTKALLASTSEQLKKIGEAAAKTAEKTDQLVGEVQATVKESREPLAATLKNTQELTARLAKDEEAVVAKLTKTLDELTARVGKAADSLDALARDGDRLVVENHKNVYETIRGLRDAAYHLEQAAKRIRANPSVVLFGADETPEERRRADETDLRLKGRARRYDKENPK